jgi:hypothetical protein
MIINSITYLNYQDEYFNDIPLQPIQLVDLQPIMIPNSQTYLRFNNIFN